MTDKKSATLCPCCEKPNIEPNIDVDEEGLYMICQHCACRVVFTALPRTSEDELEFTLAEYQPCKAISK